MRKTRLTIICIAFMQILALTLWGVPGAVARTGAMSVASSTVSGDAARTGVTSGQPCPSMTRNADCGSDCCHHGHCDNLLGCQGIAAGAAIEPATTEAERIDLSAADGGFPPFRQVLAGQSIPPPPRPPNG